MGRHTYDSTGAPVSVQVGSDPASASRYYYVYNAHGDVVSLVDSNGASVASYSYDSWGNLTSSNEAFTNGWSNPYRYDGRDGARYDASDGLYWLSVRAYDPTLGRFLARDPLGRAPLFFADNPYVYAGNNPLSNVDPSGQRTAGASASQVKQAAARQAGNKRMQPKKGTPKKGPTCDPECQAQNAEARGDLIYGIVKLVGSLAGLVVACWVGALCLSYVRFAAPLVLDGMHDILNALDIFYRYDWGGALASGWTFVIRMGKVAIDLLQLLLLVNDIADLAGSLTKAEGFLKAFGTVVQDEFSKAPEENKLWGIWSSTLAIGDMARGGALSDFADLQQVEAACLAPNAHCFG